MELMNTNNSMINTILMTNENYDTLFRDIFQYPDYLMGDLIAPEPNIIELFNGKLATQLLFKHFKNKSKITFHTDVDMDGIGTCYILRNWVRQVAPFCNVQNLINSEKQHGIGQLQLDFLNSLNSDLVIILDSATNDIEYIKQLNCDCLVIDHHEILHSELSGKTANGSYVIVNSMAPNGDKYPGLNTLSAGLTVYEFLRYFQSCLPMEDLLKQMKLYQWAVITLFTDYMNNDNLRNLYYIQTTRNDSEKESGLAQMLESVGSHSMFLNKSDIGFTLAPLFNRAIRAGYSGYALDIALNHPKLVSQLLVFRDYQDEQTKDFDVSAVEYDKFVSKNITDSGVNANYAGLIAMKLLDKFSKTSIVYGELEDGLIGGSFRGASEIVDYRKLLEDMGYFAQGHKAAFGFKFPKDKMDEIMHLLVSYEESSLSRNYLTAGYVGVRGIHHIDDILDFQSKGYLWKLGVINSCMATNINIVIASTDLEYIGVNQKHTMYTYSFHGIQLIAFEEIVASEANIYIEFKDNLKLYVKNKWR